MYKDFFEAKSPKQLCKLLGIPETETCKIELRRNFVIAIKKTSGLMLKLRKNLKWAKRS